MLSSLPPRSHGAHVFGIVLSLFTFELVSAPALAQSPADSVHLMPARKSPTLAGVVGFIVPGAGHWYAEEPGRGTLVAAVYWAGVALTEGGQRTDRVGHIGGVMLLGALTFSIVDGAHAASRFNARIALRAGTPPPQRSP